MCIYIYICMYICFMEQKRHICTAVCTGYSYLWLFRAYKSAVLAEHLYEWCDNIWLSYDVIQNRKRNTMWNYPDGNMGGAEYEWVKKRTRVVGMNSFSDTSKWTGKDIMVTWNSFGSNHCRIMRQERAVFFFFCLTKPIR